MCRVETTMGWEEARSVGSTGVSPARFRRKGFPAFGSARLGSKEPCVPDDVLVLELLEKRYLPNRGGRHALLLLLQPDSFERHDLVRDAVAGLVHHPVRPLADLLHLLEVVHRRGDAPRGGGGRRGHRASTPRARRCAQSEAILGVVCGFFQSEAAITHLIRLPTEVCSHNSASVVKWPSARMTPTLSKRFFWQNKRRFIFAPVPSPRRLVSRLS